MVNAEKGYVLLLSIVCSMVQQMEFLANADPPILGKNYFVLYFGP